MSKGLTEQDYESIVTEKFVFGKTVKQIAAEHGLSESAVGFVTRGFQNVRDGKWDPIITDLKGGQNIKIHEWAAKSMG